MTAIRQHFRSRAITCDHGDYARSVDFALWLDTLSLPVLNRIYRGTPAVASLWVSRSQGGFHWRNRSAGCARDRDKTHLDESQAFHRWITDMVRPGLDWPLGLNRQPAVACSGTTPFYSGFIRYLFAKVKGKCIGTDLDFIHSQGSNFCPSR